MTGQEFIAVLEQRASAVNYRLSPTLVESMTQYFLLLVRWSAKVNLTGFDLSSPSVAALDRLFLEPLIAAQQVDSPVSAMIDLGSGGGSPAIPMALALDPDRFTMVEVRTKKATFLREAVRILGLSNTVDVQAVRFEGLVGRPGFEGSFSLVTTRAVRFGSVELAAAARLLQSGGKLLAFHAAQRPLVGIVPGDVRLIRSIELGTTAGGALSVLSRA